jgi:DinB superfamily
MPATYPSHLIDAGDIPRADNPAYQHVLDVYASEINKVASVWRSFDDGVLDYRPHPKSMTVADIFKHELLSARRFFGGFLGLPEPDAALVVPDPIAVDTCVARLGESARARLPHLARADRAWWDAPVPFFDVERTRTWVFWRRVLHSAHHRTQLTVYVRLLDRPVPPIYGPTADVTWSGADPTRSVEAAQRRN